MGWILNSKDNETLTGRGGFWSGALALFKAQHKVQARSSDTSILRIIIWIIGVNFTFFWFVSVSVKNLKGLDPGVQQNMLSMLSGPNFANFLSVILALFSILVALLFYFQAAKSSRDFYLDSYNFMKDASTTLGETRATMEGRFDRIGDQTKMLHDQLMQRIDYAKDQKGEEFSEKVEALTQKVESIAVSQPSEGDDKKEEIIELRGLISEISKLRSEWEILRQQRSQVEMSRHAPESSQERTKFSKLLLRKRFFKELVSVLLDAYPTKEDALKGEDVIRFIARKLINKSDMVYSSLVLDEDFLPNGVMTEKGFNYLLRFFPASSCSGDE